MFKRLVAFMAVFSLLLSISTLSAQNIQELELDIINFRQQLLYEPDNPEINYNIAMAYQLMNQLDPAAKHLERFLHVSSDDIDAITALSRIYWKMGKTSASRDLLLKAHLINPLDSQVNYGLGIVYTDLAEFENAIIHLTRACESISCSDDSPATDVNTPNPIESAMTGKIRLRVWSKASKLPK